MSQHNFDSDDLLVPANADRSAMPPEIGLSHPHFFPPPTATNEDGLLCIGGRLSPEWLLDAYRHGIFPWPMWENEPMVWWSLDPRAIIELDSFHVSKRLQRTIGGGRFEITIDRDFDGVIRGCATAAGREGETWLTPPMIDAYRNMHRLGHAHSVEAWHDGQLAGGVYGLAIGGLFAAESMFYLVRDGSKVALAALVGHLHSRGYRLVDVQQWTPHTGRMGAIEIPRLAYLRRLAAAVDLPITFRDTIKDDKETH